MNISIASPSSVSVNLTCELMSDVILYPSSRMQPPISTYCSLHLTRIIPQIHFACIGLTVPTSGLNVRQIVLKNVIYL